jgi:hypothetical protein
MNIDKLKAVIQAANPEIMELTPEQTAIQQMAEHCDFVGDQGGLSAVNQIAESLNNETGRPIRLSDVLLAMQKLPNTDGNRHHVINRLGEFLLYEKGAPGMIVKPAWSLKDDNLDYQSDETKQFLTDILMGKEGARTQTPLVGISKHLAR